MFGIRNGRKNAESKARERQRISSLYFAFISFYTTLFTRISV